MLSTPWSQTDGDIIKHDRNNESYFIINLTLLKAKKPVVKNVKLLKNYLMNLTVTIVYPPNGFKFHVLANGTNLLPI